MGVLQRDVRRMRDFDIPKEVKLRCKKSGKRLREDARYRWWGDSSIGTPNKTSNANAHRKGGGEERLGDTKKGLGRPALSYIEVKYKISTQSTI